MFSGILYLDIYVHAHTHTCTRTCAHTHVHTGCMHTHTCTHNIHTCICMVFNRKMFTVAHINVFIYQYIGIYRYLDIGLSPYEKSAGRIETEKGVTTKLLYLLVKCMQNNSM